MRVVDHPGVSTLVGSPKEVQEWLSCSHADRVFVVTFEHMQPDDIEALTTNFATMASSMFEVLLNQHERESLERLAEILIPRIPPSSRLLKEAAMLVQARKAVLGSGDWLTTLRNWHV